MKLTDTPESPSSKTYEWLRAAVLRGDFPPGGALKPQQLAAAGGVSLSVIRECLLRLVGEGLAERLPNRGFVVPQAGDARWQVVSEARSVVEPTMLRMSVERGDLEWEARVSAAYHRLANTPGYERDDDVHYSDAWARAHYRFHRTLLDACGNDVLLDTFDRLWTASELSRRWSASSNRERDALTEHRQLKELALKKAGEAAAAALVAHIIGTTDGLKTPRSTT